MRCPTERTARAAFCVVVVGFMVYIATYSDHTSVIRPQLLSLSLPKQDTPETPQDSTSSSNSTITTTTTTTTTTSTSPPTSKQTLRPFTVINNRVVYLDKLHKGTTTFKKGVVDLDLSEAAALLAVNYSQYDPKDRPYLESRARVMVERARQMKRACLSNPPAARTGFPHLVWDQIHNVVWCPNYKVASTTWMVNFMKLAHFNDDNPDIPKDLPPEVREELKFSPQYGAKHGKVHELYPAPPSFEDKLAVVLKSARLIVVRHPFTRILSAFRDKMQKLNPRPVEFQFRKLQKMIIKKYRPSDSPETSPFPTFSEFVQHVIDFTAAFTSAQDWRDNVKCWVPFWAQCNVCTMDYNVIIKLETMPLDQKFLFTLTNMEELKTRDKEEWRHLNTVSSTEAAPDYYRQLTTRQMFDLYQRYQFDFKLFNYTLDAYLPLATDFTASRTT